jgi:hypothetical protein
MHYAPSSHTAKQCGTATVLVHPDLRTARIRYLRSESRIALAENYYYYIQ